MKNKFLGILSLALILGVVTANNIKEDKELVVRDVLLENTNKVGNRIRKNVENDVAENKVSEVKAQVSNVYKDANDGNRIDIRFVAGVDSYAYTNAKFNITIKDGEEVYKTVEKYVNDVYAAIEVKGEVLTAAEAFGDDYNYLISYTIKNVPETAWTYNFEATASVSADSGETYTTTDVAVKNIAEIQRVEAAMAPVYILGDVFTTYDGWSVGTPMNVVGEYTYEFTADLGIGSFIVCGVDHLSSEGTKLKNNKGGNFAIDVAGNWTLRITREDKSQDPAWLPCSEANQGIELAQAYYQLIPNFEIIVATTIEKLYLNGDAVGGWDTYTEFTRVSDSLFEATIKLNGSSGVVTAQKSRGDNDMVFKLPGGGNIATGLMGNHKIQISLDPMDNTWTELTDSKKNYEGSIYIKFECLDAPETRVNLLTTIEGVTAETSSTANNIKTGDKVFDGKLGDNNRWESVQGVDPQWIEIDMGAEYSFNGLDIQWRGAANAKTYTIEISTDGEHWEVILDITNEDKTRNRLDEYTFETKTARYIKFHGTSRNSAYGYSVDEIYVWAA